MAVISDAIPRDGIALYAGFRFPMGGGGGKNFQVHLPNRVPHIAFRNDIVLWEAFCWVVLRRDPQSAELLLTRGMVL